MPRKTTALFALLLLTALPTTAQALELGVQDDGRTSTAVQEDTTAIGGNWTRTTVYIGQTGVAQRIRDAHEAGQKIILTVGGTGTRSRKPSFVKALKYIHSLPRADRYTISNEPDLDGVKACTYRKGWMKARKVLGKRLLFGDFSPHAPVTYTAAVRRCGKLPARLDMALHPYYPTDPLAARCDWEGGICNLGRIKRVMRGMGVRVSLWLDEFSYIAEIGDERIAWLWPRAMKQATRQHAKVLIVYTSKGASWNTRPGPLSWCSLMAGRACPGAVSPDVHREPKDDEPAAVVRHMDPVVHEMFDYVSA